MLPSSTTSRLCQNLCPQLPPQVPNHLSKNIKKMLFLLIFFEEVIWEKAEQEFNFSHKFKPKGTGTFSCYGRNNLTWHTSWLEYPKWLLLVNSIQSTSTYYAYDLYTHNDYNITNDYCDFKITHFHHPQPVQDSLAYAYKHVDKERRILIATSATR